MIDAGIRNSLKTLWLFRNRFQLCFQFGRVNNKFGTLAGGAATGTALDGIGLAEDVIASSTGLALHNAGGFQFRE